MVETAAEQVPAIRIMDDRPSKDEESECTRCDRDSGFASASLQEALFD
jgi:hypothetical protein